MKNKLTTAASILIVISIGLTSCSRQSNLSLIKRSNTNSNEIVHNKKVNHAPIIEQKEIVVVNKSKDVEVLKTPAPIPSQTIAIQNKTSNETATINKEDAGIDKNLYSQESKLFTYSPLLSNETNTSTKAFNPGNSHQDFFLYVVLAILLPPVCVGLWEGGFTMDFWISLILTICFWIPGVIFALYIILR